MSLARFPPMKSIRLRRLKDIVATRWMLSLTVFCALLLVLIVAGLLLKSWTVLSLQPLNRLLFSSTWAPSTGEFGLSSFILSTVWVTSVAMLIAVPLSILTAIYLAEYAPSAIRSLLKPLLDLLAGIPSVVHGLFGLLVIVPLVREIAAALGVASNGYNVLSAGIVLAIMVFPVTISISEEVIRTVPLGMREASMALGATKWQATKLIVLRGASPGILAAVVLGFSRAIGETMAVLMVAGNGFRAPSSVFDPAQPLPALIANFYGEVMTDPSRESALMFAALVLLVIVLVFSVLARMVLVRLERRYTLG
jgi:phosphate transport system permease protein